MLPIILQITRRNRTEPSNGSVIAGFDPTIQFKVDVD